MDERGRPVLLDDAARPRLVSALDRGHVVAVRLFGSQATGRAGPLSDVDIAIWVDPAVGDVERYRLRLELISAAASALGTDEVDLVILNDAPPLLQHRVLRDGMLLIDRDPELRIALDTSAVLRYLDTEPLREQLAEGLRTRLEEGSYGRSTLA